jgi:hypothetical protein
MKVAIEPGTRVGALLDAYPELEEVLIGMAAPFEKLRNPVLRKTVGKVATLEQAAKIGGVGLRELVSRLREAAGVGGDAVVDGCERDGAAWLSTAPVEFEIDADAMLERGVHPFGRVRECAAKLQAGRVIRLTSAFRPEPLIETMRRAGLEARCEEIGPGEFVSWFGRLDATPPNID